ncbi:MAG: threonine dehydratase [Alphaproteobacteria bacterium]
MLATPERYSPPDLKSLREAADLVHGKVQPTLQYCWPLLSQSCGCQVWVKHENHTPIGAFKVRGGLVYLDALIRHEPDVLGVVTATSGNHGQSVAFAARQYGLPVTVVAPEMGAVEKKAAMAALGAEVIEYGKNFNEAYDHAASLARSKRYHFMPSFHPLLVLGVASYSLELFGTVSDLDTVYVPIGLGSGICGMIHVRDALNLKTRIVGVVPAAAPTYTLSFKAGKVVPAEIKPTILGSLINERAAPLALDIIRQGAERIVEVTDGQVIEAMRLYFTATHNLAEPGGAAALAALWSEKHHMTGQRIGIVLTGANADMASFYRYIAPKGAVRRK